MEKLRTRETIQVEIRKLENRYATLFSKSHLQRLSPIKQRLDELKLQLKSIALPEPQGVYELQGSSAAGIGLRSVAPTSTGAEMSMPGETVSIPKETMSMPGDSLTMSTESSQKTETTEFVANVTETAFDFTCPDCSAKLGMGKDLDDIIYIRCDNGHRFSKEELILKISEKIEATFEVSFESIARIA